MTENTLSNFDEELVEKLRGPMKRLELAMDKFRVQPPQVG